MSSNVSAAKSHFVKFNIKYLITKKPEDLSRVLLGRKTWRHLPRTPLKGPQLQKRKNKKPLIFLKNAQFFVGASPLLSDVLQKIYEVLQAFEQ